MPTAFWLDSKRAKRLQLRQPLFLSSEEPIGLLSVVLVLAMLGN